MRVASGALFAVAGVVFVVVVSPPAHANHAAQTLEVNPSEGQRGAVVAVSGENCEYDGKPFQYASLYVHDGSGRKLRADYPVRSDGSWSGELRVPDDMTGNVTIGADCIAADMVFVGQDKQFRILEGGPASLSRTPDSSPVGGQVRASGERCRANDGSPLREAAVYLGRPDRPRGGVPPPATPLPSPVAKVPVTSDGRWATSFAVPESMEPGGYEVRARCWNDVTVLETTRLPFTVTATNPTTTSPSVKAATAPPPTTTSSAPAATAETTTTIAPNDEEGQEVALRRPRGKRPDTGGGLLLPLTGAALLIAAAGAALVTRRRGLLPSGHSRPPEQ